MGGSVTGYSGGRGTPDHRDWGSAEYGPGAMCVDTTQPFQVSASFHTEGGSQLTAVELLLSQLGKPCTISKRMENYHPTSGRDPWPELTDALSAGMTPVISYWGAEDPESLTWLDGPGNDGDGPCTKGADNPSLCPENVRFYDFLIK